MTTSTSTCFLRFISILSCGYTLQVDSLHLFIFSLKRHHTYVCRWIGPALASLSPDKTRLFLSPGEDEQMNFGKLEKLSSEDIGESLVTDGSIFEDKIKEVEKTLKHDSEESTPEKMDAEEFSLYAEMYNELTKGEDQVYGSLLEDLSSRDGGESDIFLAGPIKNVDSDGSSSIFDDADGIGAINTSLRSEEFVDRAIAEALREAREIADVAEGDDDSSRTISAEINSSSIREDKELMLQIDALFDRASKELIASAETMRQEQAAVTKQNDRNRQAKVKDEQERLKEAEESVTSLIANMKNEATQVQNAIAEFEVVRSRASKDPLLQIANFRNLNIAKQSAFVGSLLFLIRAVSELPPSLKDGSHVLAAAVQFGIAVVFAALFCLL